jgi:monofunctional biosynthetic peptidoglycan transglycosylase
VPLRRLRRGCARLVVLVLAGAAALAIYWAATWPDVARLASENPSSTAFIDSWKSRQPPRGLPPAPAWTWVPYGRISPHLKRAVLVGEDINFFTHRGFDLGEIRRALAEAWEERTLQRGASTITQQVAKNLWLSSSWNPLRKLRESLLARQLEEHLTKRRILEIYLNVAEFGPGVYGAEAASRKYFGRSAADLDAERAAQLAAGLPRPSTWHPGSPSRAYQRRVRTLLRRMSKAEFLARQI